MGAFDEYIRAIKNAYARGDATEHTHRPALKAMLESAAKGITATNEPKRILCGSPDFQITRKGVPVGHVETKDIDTNLDEIERGKGPHGEQFIRYRDALPNWLLSDYLEFRWFVGGVKRLTVRVAELDAKRKVVPLPGAEEDLAGLLAAFYENPALTVATAKELAERMAGMTRIIRSLIVGALEHEKQKGWLHNWLAAFREMLIPDLGAEQFADMFSQTIAYGLFAAKVHSPMNMPFARESAAHNLPKTNPFLRKLFEEIAGVSMPDAIAWAVDDIVELLKHADLAEILADFGKGKGKDDPVVHFYETFLAAYDPKMRELRGVYYTPGPVVSYIVKSIDELLMNRFKRPKGIADEKTLFLDPAVGTATFLYFVIDHIYRKFAKQKAGWNGYVSTHLLNRIFGFEILMAPYAVAHLKLGMQLQETGYKFGSDQRLGIYLTNTLEEAVKRSEQLFAEWVAEEANAAAEIKSKKDILVVLGNPPYSGHSATQSTVDVFIPAGASYEVETAKGVVKRIAGKNGAKIRRKTFIGKLIEDYKVVDGQPLAERNPKWLQDDYVKFIRFAEWRIDRTGEGIVGFITNHGYLDNPTFRGMRQHLMQTFSTMYVYNLHGNAKKKEIATDGSKDENVFDIMQGVAIILCVKDKKGAELANVYYCDLWGSRSEKYAILADSSVSTTQWREARPASPNYLFVCNDPKIEDEYGRGVRVTDIFPVNGWGIATRKDYLLIDFDRDALAEKFADIARMSVAEATWKYSIRSSPHWDFSKAKPRLPSGVGDSVRRVLFRPFDVRHIFYEKAMIERGDHRYALMQHMLASNLALITVRRVEVASGFDHVFCTNELSVLHTVSMKEGNFVFPLYLYPNGDPPDSLFDCDNERRPNLSASFIADLTDRLNVAFSAEGRGDLIKTIGPADIFHYLYAVLHSPTYRQRYCEFLKIDFPRLPLTSNIKLFRALAARGAELVSLHLLDSPILDDFLTDWAIEGDNMVDEVRYAENEKRVWINNTQFFDGVPENVWRFRVGGYQVCQKWLKDRKGRKLSYDDTQRYQKIVVALNETIRLMADVDASIEKVGGWPIR